MSVRLVVFTLLTVTATAEIHRGGYILFEGSVTRLDQFGYTRNGHLNLTISNLSLAPQPLCDPNGTAHSKLGFFLCTSGFFKGIEDGGSACPLQSPSVFPVLTLNPIAPGSSHSVLYNITSRPTELYSLVFANCLPYVRVSMDYRVEAYNVVNGKRDYLPIGKTALPCAYFLFSTAYFVLFVLWTFLFHESGKGLECVHSFMISTVALKALKLLVEAEAMRSIKRTGFGHGWDVLSFIFSFFEWPTFFTMIALIGAGWSSLKPSLNEDEQTVLIFVIPLQILVSFGRMAWADGLTFDLHDLHWWISKLLVWCPDFVCCFLVSLPIIWSIKNLRGRPNSTKMALFRQYGYVVAAYMFLTRVVAFAMEFIAWYKYLWTRFVVAELAALGFCVFIGFMLRPHSRNPYFVVMDDKEEEKEASVEQSKLEDEFEML